MTGICGWVGGKGDASESRQIVDNMLATFDSGESVRRHEAGIGWGVACAGLNHQLIDVCLTNGLEVAVIGSPRFTEPALEQQRSRDGLARTLAQVYTTRRERTFAVLGGAFAVLIIDSVRGSAAIAIDRMGIHCLNYAQAGNVFVVSTSCDAINAHPAASPEIDPQAIYDYLYFHMVPAPGTIYRGYRRLLPGQYALFQNGQVTLGQYWSMHFEENHRAPFTELKEEFLDSLRKAVREGADGVETGCFLSGGTDSSTLSGLLGEVTGKPARTYSIGFDEPGFDEMDYARIAVKHFGTDQHEYYVTPADIVDAIPLISQVYDQPFGNSSAVPAYYCARMARRDGIERLLGGDGGDELFGGNDRYAKQHVFSLYERIPASLRKGLVTPVLTNFPGADKLPLLRKAKSYVVQASIPMPARIETYNLLERIGQGDIFTPGFLTLIDTRAPLQHIEGIYNAVAAPSLINRMLALDFRVTLADNDLPKVVTACDLAGVEVNFPMLADPVVAFSAKLAPELKLKGTKLRYFFKEALRGFLPNEIISKQKHGFGLPFGPWLISHGPLRAIVIDSLQSLKQRGIVEPRFIDELTARHLMQHASYYGTLVWVLVMLEQWLQNHGHSNFRLY